MDGIATLARAKTEAEKRWIGLSLDGRVDFRTTTITRFVILTPNSVVSTKDCQERLEVDPARELPTVDNTTDSEARRAVMWCVRFKHNNVLYQT